MCFLVTGVPLPLPPPPVLLQAWLSCTITIPQPFAIKDMHWRNAAPQQKGAYSRLFGHKGGKSYETEFTTQG